MRSRFLARMLAGSLLAMAFAEAPAALAESRVEALKKRLGDDEFRVRTQAALSLGDTKDDAAVPPLCGALDDSEPAVRSAAAAALGKLGKKEGLPCLKAKESGEANASVKSQIAKSIKLLSGGAAPSANARTYVAIGKITNKTTRSASDVESLVREAATSKLGTMDGYAVAPAGESSAAAKKVVEGRSLKGFQLLVTVEAPVYAGDKLTVAIRVVMTTYPGRDIKAEFAPKLSQTGTPSTDRAAEDMLVKMAIERALTDFDKVVASM
jgi:HEAT repeat protein